MVKFNEARLDEYVGSDKTCYLHESIPSLVVYAGRDHVQQYDVLVFSSIYNAKPS